jgi:hypothetical protein
MSCAVANRVVSIFAIFVLSSSISMLWVPVSSDILKIQVHMCELPGIETNFSGGPSGKLMVYQKKTKIS